MCAQLPVTILYPHRREKLDYLHDANSSMWHGSNFDTKKSRVLPENKDKHVNNWFSHVDKFYSNSIVHRRTRLCYCSGRFLLLFFFLKKKNRRLIVIVYIKTSSNCATMTSWQRQQRAVGTLCKVLYAEVLKLNITSITWSISLSCDDNKNVQ